MQSHSPYIPVQSALVCNLTDSNISSISFAFLIHIFLISQSLYGRLTPHNLDIKMEINFRF